MITVTITGLGGKPVQEVTKGDISWDGQQYILNPQTEWMQEIVEGGAIDPGTGMPVTSADPERFLNCLQYKYRSPYFRASAPMTS